MTNKINSNFWYVRLFGCYSSGIWFPFNSKEEAINYVKKEIGDCKIKYEGEDKLGYYNIELEKEYGFNHYSISQRKKDRIIKEEYIE